MPSAIRMLIAGLALAATLAAAAAAQEPKHGGVIKIYHRDSPGSASVHEEATYSTNVPFMSVFNNLVEYKQDVPQNSMQSIVPDLATGGSWSADNKDLTFKLREGVKWHHGQPFTANDVKCTFDKLMEKTEDKFRKNPRKTWYSNVTDVSADSPTQVTFHLNRPQPSLLASGYSPIYPCHLSARDMRLHPIGTGPFKFVEFKENLSIKLARNPDYWKEQRPFLDGIEFTIVPNRSTAILAFIAGKFDMTFPTEVSIPLLKDIHSQAPKAICETTPLNVSINLIINRDAPPFDNAEVRKAMALALDRKSFMLRRGR
jgi:peptide/nickel transport system substrate-binding protein